MKSLFYFDRMPSFWSRVAARGMDYCITYLIFTLLSMVFPFYIEDLYYFGFALIVPILFIPIETVCLSCWGTTLGKKVFGVRVENRIGGKLSLPAALKRAIFLSGRPGVICQKKNSFSRKLISVIALVVLIAGTCYQKEIAVVTTGFEKYKSVDGWIDYTSQEGKFRVVFPEDPESESKTLPVPSQSRNLNYMELKSYQTKKVYYSVAYIQLPRKWKMAGSSRLLEGTLDLIVEHTPGLEVITKNLGKHQNLRSLDFHLKQEGEEIRGRLILVGTTLYRLTAVYPQTQGSQVQHQEFFDSFSVTR